MNKDEKCDKTVEILLEFQSETGVFPPASYVEKVLLEVGLDCGYCKKPSDVCSNCGSPKSLK